jgi:hypothetical protein
MALRDFEVDRQNANSIPLFSTKSFFKNAVFVLNNDKNSVYYKNNQLN